MPGLFITALVFAIPAVICLGVYGTLIPASRRSSNVRTSRRVFGFIALSLAFFAALFTLFSSATVVSTKNVGVVTEFGRPTGAMSNGIHFAPPWANVTEISAAIQTDSHAGDSKKDDTPCTTVRLANQSTACVDNSIRWRIKRSAADTLFRDYHNFGHIRDSLVTRELNAALNEAFATYDPLATLAATANNSGANVLGEKAKQVTDQLRSEIGGQIDVLNVIIPLVHYDASTQDKVNKFQAELANTRIAKQRELTAAAEAEANRQLAASVSQDPNVLVSKCLDTLNRLVEAHQAIPPGFSCWPSSQSPVLIGTK